jgi:RNA-directed DNA polymerase
LEEIRPFSIQKQLFAKAFEKVKENAGTFGVDGQLIEDFERNLKDNLYKIWNRMSSGSYFPPPVKAVPIPKKTGGKRILGIPTVGDRICQMVVKLALEPVLEPYFLSDSYGYRPNKSALDAIKVTRQRCWRYSWVVEYDIRGCFDNISHQLLMKAVKTHTDVKWIVLYIERWLKAPMQQENGTVEIRDRGTPQGGVISPLLCNLFLHYVFDHWMTRKYPEVPWCRYADDGLLHCKTLKEAEEMMLKLRERFAECGLELHPEKTKIVHCEDEKDKANYPNKSFDYLGYTFKARICKNTKDNSFFMGFNPAVSENAKKSMRARIRKDKVRLRNDLDLEELAEWYNPILQGWLSYYGAYHGSEMRKVLRHFNLALVNWARRKYQALNRSKTQASRLIMGIAKKQPELFVHWRGTMIGPFI